MYILNSECCISAPHQGKVQSYETDYNESVYFIDLQRQIKSIRRNLEITDKLQNVALGHNPLGCAHGVHALRQARWRPTHCP